MVDDVAALVYTFISAIYKAPFAPLTRTYSLEPVLVKDVVIHCGVEGVEDGKLATPVIRLVVNVLLLAMSTVALFNEEVWPLTV